MLQKPLQIKAFFPLQKPNQLFFFFIWVIAHDSKLNYFPFYDLQNIAYSQSKQMKKGEQEKILDRGSLGAKTWLDIAQFTESLWFHDNKLTQTTQTNNEWN